MASENVPDTQAMIRAFMGFIPARIIYVAAKLGLTDLIDDHGATPGDLAKKLSVHPDALYRIMRALAGLGILHQGESGLFRVTPLGETLRQKPEQSVRDYAIFMHEFVYEGLRNLAESVHTGTPAFDHLFGMPLFEYLQANPEQAKIFHAGMGSRGRIDSTAILEIYDFSASRMVIDVGGGSGAFLFSLVARYQQMSGVLFDQTSAIEAARSSRSDQLARCQLIAGDFFEEVPAGGDMYIMKRVLFDWPDEKAVHILQNCRRAMAEEGRLLIIEPLMGPANQPSQADLYDIIFLAMVTGMVRKEEEYAALLREAGFRLNRTLATASDLHVLEAVADYER